MKKIIVILLAFFNYPFGEVFAQSGERRISDKFSVGITYSPDHGSRKVIASQEGEELNQLYSLGTTAGFNFQYEVSNRLGLETGVLLADKNFNYEIANSNPKSMVASSLIETSRRFLEVPLKANFYLVNDDFQVYLTGGPAVSFLLSEKRFTTKYYHINPEDSVARVAISRENENIGPSKIALSTFVGAGIGYKLNNNLLFRAEPIYRRTFAFDFGTPFRSYLDSFGLNLGMFVKF